MTLTICLSVAGILLGIATSALVSGSETGLFGLNRVRLRVFSEQGRRAAQRLASLVDRQDDVLITLLLLNTVADYIATASLAEWLQSSSFSAGLTELYTVLILTPLMLVFGGIIPKDWFQREGDRLMYPLALPLAILVRGARATGLVWLLRNITGLVMRRFDPLALARGEIHPRSHALQLIEEGAVRGGLSAMQRDIIDRIVNLAQVRCGGVMIPLARAAHVPVSISRDDFLRIARMAHFSRLPVHDGDPRRVIGVVNVYDVLTDEQHQPISTHMRPAVRLSAGDSVPVALLRLQQARQAMAAVTDRAGNCVGILTLKDLVEEIVGELEVW
ncbi:MAG: CNNM domain-containing protein [Phycisphaerae bacterium]